MSDVAQSATPAVNTPATASESTENSQENEELDALEAEESEEVEEESEESSEKEEKSAKPVESKEKAKKKDEKALEKRIKKLKLKVDGQEFEESLDLDNEEELIKHLQLSKMGQKRAKEKADLESQVKAFFEAFEKDPFAAMKELGKDPNKAIDDYINQQLEHAKKSPEQLAKEQLEAELQALKSEREKERETHKTKELARLQEQAFQQYDMQMEQTLSKSGLPKTPYTVKKMADYMLVALEAGKNVTPDDVVDIVKEEMESDLKEMFSSLPEEQIEALLGEQVLNKLRKRRIAKAKEAQQAVGKPKIEDSGKSVKQADGKKDAQKISYRDFFKV